MECFDDCQGNTHTSKAAANAVECLDCAGTPHDTQAAADAVECFDDRQGINDPGDPEDPPECEGTEGGGEFGSQAPCDQLLPDLPSEWPQR